MTNLVTAILTGALGVALLQVLVKLVQWIGRRFGSSRPDVVEERRIHAAVTQADESIVVIAKSRDALAADNARLRSQMDDRDADHLRERAEWRAERQELRLEIDKLESRLDTTMAELDATLSELRQLKAKHNLTG